MASKQRLARSRSPQRSPNTSTERRRRPLHERSDSQTNRASIGDSTRASQDSMYSKDPFPRLPSQILAPRDSPFIFHDETAGVSENVAPAVPGLQSSFSGTSLPTSLDKYEAPATGQAPVQTQSQTPTGDSAPLRVPQQPRRQKPVFSIADRFKQRHKHGRVSGRSRSSFDSAKTSTKSARSSRRSTETAGDPATETASLASHQGEYSRPTRARSSASLVSRGDLRSRDEPSEAAVERPRSASTPAAPTEAFIEALMSNGENVQYPELRKPSMQSLKSQSSSTKMAYPPPLKLNRKAGNSRLKLAASDGARRLRLDSTDPAAREKYGPFGVSPLRQNPIEHKVSGRWMDELDDTVTELNPPLLKAQRSLYRRDSNLTRRANSFDSSHSSINGYRFYNLGNDSKTGWASAYYRNGDLPLRIATPPSVTNLQSANSLADRSRSSRPRSKSVSGSGRSSSPDSSGFPEGIFIPRIRPLQRPARSSSEDWESTADPGTTSSVIDEPPSAERTESLIIEPVTDPALQMSPNHQVHQAPGTQDQQPPVTWSEPFNPTPELPHLSFDRGVPISLYKWRAPSIEDTEGPLGPTNRQILLFCSGFLVPFSWMIAAALSTPRRPHLLQGSPDAEAGKRKSTNDLYDSHEIRVYQKARWWRNLNRFMSMTGLCVIVIVIVVAVVSTH